MEFQLRRRLLLRALLLVVGSHYVDDFNAVDYPEGADSAFSSFAEFFEQGVQGPAARAQSHPAGVSFSLSPQGGTVDPTERRVNRLTEDINGASYGLTPEEAYRLARRLAFLTQSVFGSVGRAALSPVYARSHDTAAREDASGLRLALRALLALLANAQPRFIPFYPTEQYFMPTPSSRRAQRHKAGHVDASARAQFQDRWNNGWGFVLRIGTKVFFANGTIPIHFLKHFAAHRAFIYVLEIIAQLIALTTFARHLPELWVAWIDNSAGEAALKKGHGKDMAVNGVLAAFWALASRMRWSPEFNRAKSAANIAHAVSRGDLTTARAQGWTPVRPPLKDILAVFAKCADDLNYANHEMTEDLFMSTNFLHL